MARVDGGIESKKKALERGRIPAREGIAAVNEVDQALRAGRSLFQRISTLGMSDKAAGQWGRGPRIEAVDLNQQPLIPVRLAPLFNGLDP